MSPAIRAHVRVQRPRVTQRRRSCWVVLAVAGLVVGCAEDELDVVPNDVVQAGPPWRLKVLDATVPRRTRVKLHGNARLSPGQRRLLRQRVVEEHWTVATAATRTNQRGSFTRAPAMRRSDLVVMRAQSMARSSKGSRSRSRRGHWRQIASLDARHDPCTLRPRTELNPRANCGFGGDDGTRTHDPLLANTDERNVGEPVRLVSTGRRLL